MNKENISAVKMEGATTRITRARAKALGTSGGQIQKPPRPENKRILRANVKRSASDENKSLYAPTACSQNKRRAVLAEVSNILRETSQNSCSNAAKVQVQTGKNLKKYPIRKNSTAAPYNLPRLRHGKLKGEIAEDTSEKMVETGDTTVPKNDEAAANDKAKSKTNDYEVSSPLKMEENLGTDSSSSPNGIGNRKEDAKPLKQNSQGPSRFQIMLQKDRKSRENSVPLVDPKIVNIDSDQKDPQMCSAYAPDIYSNKRVTELNYKASFEYMEKVQRDVTQSMRGVLIDWLVEVSEEYKLVPDTLYLTVNLIDRFLSGNYIEKQRLQLLGVTCMFIASKYEEISAPRVEEFCFITDNTYTKDEVVKMESQVLNLLCFQLSVPTIKTFLRRFIQAAQATSESPSVDLEYLANYLAELTLVEYSFLKFLPSHIAASAVFLARWTLDQSVHPWNPTLEHYTSYNSMDLKAAVAAIEELQLNAKTCPLKAIREKYSQERFNCVANLSPPKGVETLNSS